jgi:hypothetical protein
MDEEYVPEMKSDIQYIGIYYYIQGDEGDATIRVYKVFRKYFKKYSGYNGSQLYATPILKLKNNPWRPVTLPKKSLIKIRLSQNHPEGEYEALDDSDVSNPHHLLRDIDAPLIPTGVNSFLTEAHRAYIKKKIQNDPDLYKM